MLKKNIKTDEPIDVTVGEVRFSILRIGENQISIGVDAPRAMPVQFGPRPAKGQQKGCEEPSGCGKD